MATILVVEDEPLLRADVADLLRSAGYTVHEAQSAAAGIAVLQSELPVDLVCTDVRMPGELDGIGLTRWIKTHHPGLPVIIISGDVIGLHVASFADARLAKPLAYCELLAKIAELLAGRMENGVDQAKHRAGRG